MSLIFCIYFVLYICGTFAGATDDISLSSLVKRIEELENRDKLLMQVVTQLKDENVQQNQIILDQAAKITELSSVVTHLHDENIQQNQVIANLQEELVSVKIATDESNEPIHEHTKVERPATKSANRISPAQQKHNGRRFLLDGAETVAFHATYSGTNLQHHSVGTPIAFTHVLLNVGSGYHNSTSLFIAPIPGIYIFSSSIMSSFADSNTTHAAIVKNGQYLAGIFARSDPTTHNAEQGSVTVVTQLNTGDEVWVKHTHHDDSSLYGAGLTSFTGCLVTPL